MKTRIEVIEADFATFTVGMDKGWFRSQVWVLQNKRVIAYDTWKNRVADEKFDLLVASLRRLSD